MLSMYLRFWRHNLRALGTYRGDMVMGLLSRLLFHFEALGLIWALLHHFSSLNGWQMEEIALFYSIFLLGRAVAALIGAPLQQVPEMLREGSFDRFLVRPLPALFQVVTLPTQHVTQHFILAVGLAAMALPAAPVEWSWGNVAVLAMGAVGAAAVQLAFLLIVGSTGFWFLQADDLRELIWDLISEFGRYPTAIFSRPLQWLLHILPAAFMAYYPAAWLLGRDDSLLPTRVGAVLSPALALLWLALGLACWRAGLRRHSSTGS